jgi:hypothetical protein
MPPLAEFPIQRKFEQSRWGAFSAESGDERSPSGRQRPGMPTAINDETVNISCIVKIMPASHEAQEMGRL